MYVSQNLVGLVNIGPDTVGVSSILANQVEKILKRIQNFPGRVLVVPPCAHVEIHTTTSPTKKLVSRAVS
jgi:hypothetical protein